MVVLMEGVHVELPAEVGKDPLGAEVVVVLETEAGQSLLDAAQHLINIEGQVRVGHDKDHAVLLLHVQRTQAERVAIDAVKTFLAEGHANQFALQVIGPAVVGTGEQTAFLRLAMVALVQRCAAV